MALQPELHTIELSHDKPRLTGPRLSDVGTVPSATEPSPDRVEQGRFAPGNQVAAGRSAKQAIRRPLKDALRRVEDAIRDAVEPSEADVLVADAEAVCREAMRSVGAPSILVLAPAVRFATNSVLAGHLTNKAAEAGFTTEEGERLLGMAHQCEQQALRASTAMLANAKALGSAKPPIDPHKAAFEAFGAPPPAKGK